MRSICDLLIQIKRTGRIQVCCASNESREVALPENISALIQMLPKLCSIEHSDYA